MVLYYCELNLDIYFEPKEQMVRLCLNEKNPSLVRLFGWHLSTCTINNMKLPQLMFDMLHIGISLFAICSLITKKKKEKKKKEVPYNEKSSNPYKAKLRTFTFTYTPFYSNPYRFLLNQPKTSHTLKLSLILTFSFLTNQNLHTHTLTLSLSLSLSLSHPKARI